MHVIPHPPIMHVIPVPSPTTNAINSASHPHAPNTPISSISPNTPSNQNNAMFHPSSSSPSYADPTLLPAVCYSAAAPQPFYDSGGSLHPPLFTSSSPPYSSSFPHYLHKSSSTHSLSLPHGIPDQPPFLPSPYHHHLPQPQQPSSSPSSSSGDYFDFNAGHVRRVFSTGDLQGMSVMQAPGENYNQKVSTIPGKNGCCNPEERKEKLERYRSKRNRRNFHKKITYACRKTLADSRPRVRGRFARNGETETETEPEAEIEVAENSYECHSGYNNYEQAMSGGSGNGDWWWEMQAAPAADEEEECCYDEDVWANLSYDFSMNLPS